MIDICRKLNNNIKHRSHERRKKESCTGSSDHMKDRERHMNRRENDAENMRLIRPKKPQLA